MYLRTVLELEEEGIPALRARLSERLGISPPSISEGVARLEEQGLLRLNEDRTVGLTTDGRDKAEHVMRKHRLAERLLVDVLGLEHEFVHEEACRWEHVISDRVEARLVEFLGHPTTSPYGNPIPGASEAPDGVVPLTAVETGTVRVHSISEHLQADHDVMHVLHEYGLIAGERAQVTAVDGEVVLEVAGHELRLGLDHARFVYVVRAEG
ncbi:MAG: metal-dependent transcriptional regulator [Nitriliruptoraceae bacterium]|nr:metal-dependent transcriptional regulator [Nitriliruptoraceae bacterium]